MPFNETFGGSSKPTLQESGCGVMERSKQIADNCQLFNDP
jgi:hypothetical protein